MVIDRQVDGIYKSRVVEESRANIRKYKREGIGTSLAIQQRKFCASTVSNPSQGTKSPHATWCGQ